MKKNAVLLMISIFLLGSCSQNNDGNISESSESTGEIVSSEETSVEKKQVLYVNLPEYFLESNNFKLSGKVDPDRTVTIKTNGEIVEELSATDEGRFDATVSLPELEDTNYDVSDGESTQTVLIKSKANLEKTEAELEAERKEEERIKAEEEQKKAEEESIKKEQAAAKAAKEAEAKAEADAKRKAAEDAEREKQAILDNASREQKNALQKAKDYLNYTSFSKTSLYDQLIYEQYPEDAAQFAIDNIEVDWNAEALKKAIDYLDYTSFSDQGLYDQLIYEGFSDEQAQYAIDNLPD